MLAAVLASALARVHRRAPCHLPQYRGRHAGQDVYVVASGASAGHVEPDFFVGKAAIGVNRVYVRFPNLTYYVRKDPFVAADAAYNRTRGAVHFVSRGPYGIGDDNSNVRRLSRCGARPVTVAFPHQHNTHNVTVLPPDGQLVVSSSTITSAMHLAAYMGAKAIVLVGHDCGLLDGESNIAGYHTARSLRAAWGADEALARARYRRWLGAGDGVDIERDTIRLKRLLRDQYAVVVYSLNPFVNLALEGHRYSRVGRA